ncbi:MAG: alanine racemase [Candidatus Omnitrophica bacterium]|nr:alanine racemase [Candidatus Omnitrophota bacterium]
MMSEELDLITEPRVHEQATWVVIDKTALRHNLAQLIGLTLPNATILAVIKANAYGHGLCEVAQCLREQVSYFGVASIEEALALRHFEIGTPILLFGVPRRDAIDAAIQAGVTLAVSSVEQAREISERASFFKRHVLVHIKIDTGMGRLGIPKAVALQALDEIQNLPMLELEGIFTHFPQGEEVGDAFTRGQIKVFCDLIQKASQTSINFAYRHAANSIGIVNYKEGHFNLVRPGLSLYGIYGAGSLRPKVDLKPVLNWRSRLILIKKLMPGESTGYNRTFVAKEETTIGILPVGYSHGYPFALSNKGEVLFQGRRFRIAGRVSMDYIAVNFGPQFSEAHVGDVVTVLGRDGHELVSAEELASKAGTIPYEIVTRIHPSIPRIVL